MNSGAAPLLIQKPLLIDLNLSVVEQPKSPKKRIPVKRDTDSFNFGFNVLKLTKEQTEAATKLMQNEFSKEVGPI